MKIRIDNTKKGQIEIKLFFLGGGKKKGLHYLVEHLGILPRLSHH